MKRKLVLGSGIISLISSIITLALYGVCLVVMGGYVLLTLSFVLPFAGISSGGGGAGDLIAMLLILLMTCAVPTAIGIVSMIFATKLLKISKMQDYYYKAQKSKLITYIVFFFIFAMAMIGYVRVIVGGFLTSTTSSLFIVQILNNLPFGLLIMAMIGYGILGSMYQTTAILLLIDVVRNKNKIFKANIPAPPLTREQLATQQITQQPQIITLKPGEELPDYLKGRVIPIPPQKVREEAVQKPEDAAKSEKSSKQEKKEGADKKSK